MKQTFFTRTFFEISLIIAGIMLVSAAIPLFQLNDISLLNYGKTVWGIAKELATPHDLIYINPLSGEERNLFPIIFEAYFNSMKIFFLALIISLFISVFLLVLYFSVSERIKKSIEGIGYVISSLPDIFIIGIFQIFIVWFFKRTGILILDVAATMGNPIVLLPAITLSVLPTFFFFILMVTILKEEEEMSYVELAKSKGLRKYRILFMHMMRNVLISLTNHGKHIMWLMLSNLLMLEYLYNVFGVTPFLFSYGEPSIFAVTSIFIFLPFFMLLKILEFTFERRIGSDMNL
ncbi:ABC transporter permease subunit [Chengkuizengella axinellae]|uniref:ABC transmembrane type-1 domain-containing protein n=1 Tax=Chengkuizengella axinellae TaxID=3064388 RepID=A0ABT9J408_9BACL|nr:ABC transporter permease subunit [Chengkuizengella sp. 2205SS18-9]MDP5276303.1 hypothetical protein [Chengkuizengella sp. 2205SS18-9]